jgi:hypothetical protein
MGNGRLAGDWRLSASGNRAPAAAVVGTGHLCK